jgi:hypothetical protein
VYLAVQVVSSDLSNALQDFIICTSSTDMWALLSAGTRYKVPSDIEKYTGSFCKNSDTQNDFGATVVSKLVKIVVIWLNWTKMFPGCKLWD